MKDTNDTSERPDTVTDAGLAAPRRIKNAQSAFTIMNNMIKSDELRSRDRAKIKGMIDGARPYNEKELRSKGMSWRSNINAREGEGIIDSVTGSYTELVMDLAELIDVSILPESEIPDPSGAFGQIISEEYTRIMTMWGDFIPNYAIMVGQFARYGRGLYFRTDPISWKYSPIRTANHLVPETSGVTLGQHQIMMVRDSMPPADIYSLIENSAAETYGWKTAALRRALVQGYSKKTNEKLSDEQIASEYEQIKAHIASKDLGLDDEAFKDLPICYVLEKNISGGKVRMTVISAIDSPDEYLFEKNDAYDDFYQAASLFMYNYGEGDFHEVKGLGHKSFAHVEVSNRLFNSMIDGTVMMNSMIVTGNDTAVRDSLRIQRLGPITIIPDGLQIVQQNFQPRIDGAIAVRNLISASLNNNTGANKNQVEATGPVERTAAGVRHRAGKEANFTRNQVMLFYSQWDSYHAENVRRMLNPNYPEGWDGYEEASNMRKRCIARGVPEELLDPSLLYIRARRAIGSGSMMTKDEATGGMMQLAPSMPEEGAYNAMRDRASFFVGASNVNRYFPQENENATTNEHSIAQLENNDLFEGSVVIVGSNQKHTIHLDSHLMKLVEAAETYQSNPEAVDVMTYARYFIGAIEHCIQHNTIAKNNPVLKDDAEVFEQTIKSLVPMRDQMRRDAEKFMAEQQEALASQQQEGEEEMDPELRMKMQEHNIRMELLIKESKTKGELKEQMQNHTIRMREMKEAHRMAIQRRNG